MGHKKVALRMSTLLVAMVALAAAEERNLPSIHTTRCLEIPTLPSPHRLHLTKGK